MTATDAPSPAAGKTVAPSLRVLDAAWFTRVLRDGGHTEASVTGVAPEAMAFTGATADIARIRLTYDGDGRPGPASVIAKIRSDAPTPRAMDAAMGLYAREARFYAEWARRLPLGAPRCYHVGDGTTTPLLLEDLGGLRMGDQMQGLLLSDAVRLVDALGDFHAASWRSPNADAGWLASPGAGIYAQMIVQLVGSGVDALQARYRGRVSDQALRAVATLAPRWNEVLERCTDGPPTIVHNDCRLDNVFFRADGEPVLVDWQIVARTRGTQDVGNLLAGSMDSDLLSAHWERLLRRWHERLQAHGIRDYPWDECLLHYRQSILYPLGAGIALLGNLDIGDNRGLGDVIILRALRHCAELDSFSCL